MHINRRSFIKKSAITSAGISVGAILPARAWERNISPSDKINIALIGCRNHGFSILRHHLEYSDVNCVALCDIDSNILGERAGNLKENYDQHPRLYSDFRKMLEQKDIDAVIIGTPDHWHCLQLVYCLQAGKDVYVEKPLANTIAECNIMVEAARYYKKVVQVGQQQRSNVAFLETMNMVKEGYIGTLRKVNIWGNFNYGIGSIPREDEPVPDGVDYDTWLGPSPKRPFNRNRFHGSWRHFWDYGGGLMSDWGVHLIDMGLWAGDIIAAPGQVMTYAANTSTETRQRDSFDTMTVVYPKKDYVINWDMTAGVQQGPWEKMYGAAFIGEKGTIVTDRHSFRVYPEWDNSTNEGKIEARQVNGLREAHSIHVRNFLDCVKTRETPVCTPEIGRAAALHVHIPNIAARVGESLLIWDDQNSRFTNSEKANELITPEYRAPWTLPKIG
ncbi:MAG: Gfo/Idh/MocA family protein [Bacteroidales bacterium]